MTIVVFKARIEEAKSPGELVSLFNAEWSGLVRASTADKTEMEAVFGLWCERWYLLISKRSLTIPLQSQPNGTATGASQPPTLEAKLCPHCNARNRFDAPRCNICRVLFQEMPVEWRLEELAR